MPKSGIRLVLAAWSAFRSATPPRFGRSANWQLCPRSPCAATSRCFRARGQAARGPNRVSADGQLLVCLPSARPRPQCDALTPPICAGLASSTLPHAAFPACAGHCHQLTRAGDNLVDARRSLFGREHVSHVSDSEPVQDLCQGPTPAWLLLATSAMDHIL